MGDLCAWGDQPPIGDCILRAGLYNLSLNNTHVDAIRAFFEGCLQPVKQDTRSKP